MLFLCLVIGDVMLKVAIDISPFGANTSSLPEVVADSGLMFDPKDADALGECMLMIYSDCEFRNSLKEKSIERAKQFGWKKFIQQTLHAYTMAVN